MTDVDWTWCSKCSGPLDVCSLVSSGIDEGVACKSC